MLAPPVLKAAFSARGGGPAQIHEAAVAAIKEAGAGATHQIIAKGSENTRSVIARTRAMATRQYGVNARTVVERSVGALVNLFA